MKVLFSRRFSCFVAGESPWEGDLRSLVTRRGHIAEGPQLALNKRLVLCYSPMGKIKVRHEADGPAGNWICRGERRRALDDSFFHGGLRKDAGCLRLCIATQQEAVETLMKRFEEVEA